MSEETPRHELIWPEANVRMVFRRIPKGEFRMGSRGRPGWGTYEEPVHRVRIQHDFWLGETVVTQAQFALWTTAAGIEHENGFPRWPNHPAENMAWHEAVQYCTWLTKTKRQQFPEGFDLACLPTESEWEYACRADSTTDYYNGDGMEAMSEVGWFDRNSEWSTHAVDEAQEQHPFGLRGMHGNVSEWCHDEWEAAAYRWRIDGEPDPGWKRRDAEYRAAIADMLASDRDRVLRGGSWGFLATHCRSASRGWRGPDDPIWLSGFRVCLVRGPVPQPARQSAEAQAETGDAGAAEADALEHFRFPPRPQV